MNSKFVSLLFSTTLAGVVLVSLVDAAAKSFVLLGLAVVACLALRRASAATRHLILFSTLGAALALPALSLCLPQWRVLPEWMDVTRGTRGTEPFVAAFPPIPALPGNSKPEMLPSGELFPPADLFPPMDEDSEQSLDSLRASGVDPSGAVNGARAGLGVIRLLTVLGIGAVPPTVLLIVWGIGTVVLLWPMVRSAWTLHRLATSLHVVTNGLVAVATAKVARELGVPTPRLYLGSAGAMPMVWGIGRGRILLPAEATAWDAVRLRAVLLHELAHLRRYDPLTQAIAQVARALHWFNPLAWLALRNLRVEQERACDDYVLRGGVKPSDYAGHVLELATKLRPAQRAASVALAMADRTRIEGRLHTILDAARNRSALSRWLVVFTVLLTGSAAFSLAMLHAADEQSGAPVQRAELKPEAQAKDAPQKPKAGAKLQPGTEEKLQWGEPANGLRMALAWPPTLGEPAAGEVPDLFLAVQNVSAAPVRLCTTAEAPNQRRLTFATGGVTQFRRVSQEPNGVDATLQPREVVFLRLFTEGADNKERASEGSMLASTVRQSPAATVRADMEIAKAPAGAWTGKLVTPETRAGIGAEAPKNRKAQELFKVWLAHARVNGKIPGGLIARLGERVKEFVRANAPDPSGAPYAKRMEPLLLRLGLVPPPVPQRDWQPAEASALLNDIAAVSDAPLSVALEEVAAGRVQHGLPWEKELEHAPWSEPLSNGLRTAYIVGPGVTSRLHYVDWVGNVVTQSYAAPDKAGAAPGAGAAGSGVGLGTPLGCRILIHNAGREPVVFRTRTWHHIEPTAKDAKGTEIAIESMTRLTRAPLMTWRLEPGRYIELPSPGMGLGKYGFHDFKNADIATWISAKDGDEVTLTPGPVPLGDWNEAAVLNGEPRWWLDFLTARLNLATPLPADAVERAQLLQRTVRDIFHTDATAEEIAAFVADREPDALESLAKRLAGRSDLTPFSGSLQSGPTKFRVTAADPGAAKPADKPAAAPASPAAPAPAEKPKTEAEKRDGPASPVRSPGARDPGVHLERIRKVMEDYYRGIETDGRADPSLLERVEKEMRDYYRALGPWSPMLEAEKRASPASTPPEDKHAQELFKLWQAAARADGKIPGGLIGRLRAKVEEFVRNNRNDAFGAPYAKKVEPILARFDASHDWSPDEALALLNDLAALSSIPIETTLWADAERRVYPGQPLSADLKDAPWGEPTAEGLRAARPLDPRAKSYPIGTGLRSRILLHNDGKEPVLLRAKSFMQPGYTAHDAKGNSLQVESTYWTTLGRVETRRLAPGEFIEIATPGLGVGKNAGRDEWADVRVGSWIDVAAAVNVTLSPASIGVFVDDSRASKPATGRELKLEIIRERLDRDRPLPASAADRELIVRRVTQDIFGDEPTADEIAAFVTDKSDDPFTALASRLLRRPGLAAFVGELKPGTISFRTTPADPDAANRPKVAIGPGRYTLDDHVRLIIVGKPVAGRRTSDVEIRFWAADPKSEPPGPPYKIQVPDGFGTWAITCRSRTGILWVLTPGAVRKIDYSNPAAVKETSITRGSSDDMPDEFREVVKRILTISGVPAEQITALLAGSAPD